MKNILIASILLVCSIGLSKELTPDEQNKICDAIYIIEGGANTAYPYGIRSIKTNNPRQVCINTIRNNYQRWQKSGCKEPYLDFLANIYCPISADKKGNENWHKNIRAVLTKAGQKINY